MVIGPDDLKENAMNAAFCFIRQTWPLKSLIVINGSGRAISLPPEVKVVESGGSIQELKNAALELAQAEWCFPWLPNYWYDPDYIDFHMRAVTNSLHLVSSASGVEQPDDNAACFAFFRSALGLIRYNAEGNERTFAEQFVPSITLIQTKRLSYRIGLITHPFKVGPFPPEIKYSIRCYLVLGRYGDLLNVLPIFKHLFDATGEKPNVVISQDFADAAAWVSYWNPVIYPGKFDLTQPALEWASTRYTEVVVMQPCTRDFTMDYRCRSYCEEPWAALGLLPLRGKLPLVLDGRDLAGELELAKLHLRNRTPTILVALQGKSSPFPHAVRLREWIATKYGSAVVWLDDVKASTLTDFLTLMDAADLLITVDTAFLHLAQAVKIPVIAYLNTLAGSWSATVPCCNLAKTFRYTDALDTDALDTAVNRVMFRLFWHVHPEVVNEQASNTWPPWQLSGSNTLADIAKLTSAEPIDVIVYTPGDTYFVPDVERILRAKLCEADCFYGLRRQVAMPGTHTSADLERNSVPSPEVEFYAFTYGWWQRHRSLLETADVDIRQLMEAEDCASADLLAYRLFRQETVARSSLRRTSHKRKSREVVDHIRNYYRRMKAAPKEPLIDLTNYALSNYQSGIGDMLVMSSLPRVSTEQGGYTHIFHADAKFETLIKHNPWYKPYDGRPPVSSDFLQKTFDLGNGHLMQRLQRAWGYRADLLPRATVVCPQDKVPGRCVLHFEPGAHAQWQRRRVHGRAREVYPSTFKVIQEFVDAHRADMSFVEIGQTCHNLNGVEDRTGRSLDESIALMSGSEWFLGIVSGPMHLASALGLKCVVVLNFPSAREIMLPTLVDINQVESEWLYPQACHLHQDSEGPLVKLFSLRNLELAFAGGLYPYWSNEYLSLIDEPLW